MWFEQHLTAHQKQIKMGCFAASCPAVSPWSMLFAGVADMTDLVDRFLSQDDTQDTLQQLEQESRVYLQELQERSATLQVCQHLQTQIH